MTRRLALITRLVAVPALLALGTVAVPPVSAGNPCFHDFAMPPASTASGTEINLLACAFQPTVTQVAVGADVTFVNDSDFSHLITGANQAWGSPDVELQPGKRVSYTFDSAGVYPYACALHPGMSGAILVGDVAAGTAAGTTTDAAITGSSGTASLATATATQPTADASPLSASLVAAGMGAGVIVGAAAVWLALRRREPADRSLARAE